MRKSNSTLFERVFVLVHGLSGEEQKRLLSPYENVKKKSDLPQYIRLFQALLAHRECEKASILKASGIPANKQGTVVRYLQNAIFESLALALSQNKPGINICKAAISKSHYDYAEKILYREIRIGLTTEDLPYLYGLYKIWEQLERQYRYPMKPDPGLPTPLAFFREHATFVLAEQLYRAATILAGSPYHRA